MKYHNFKRPLAVMLAALLTLSSAAFTAIAQEAGETPEITYTLRGGSSNGDGTGDYVVELLANGGLINTGYVELSYNAEVYENVTFDFADNVRDAGYYWEIGEQENGKFAVGFMSDAIPEGQDGTLFADINNPSDTLAYIDASGDDLVRIGSFTLDFISTEYAENFNTKNSASVEVEAAKAILHTVDEFNVSQIDCDYTVSNTLVFSSDDFVVSNNDVPYIAGIGQTPDVSSDVAESFSIVLGDNFYYEVIDAGTYKIRALSVSGEGYYDAEEIVLDKDFVIERGSGEITRPANPEAVDFVPENGFDPKDLEIENWEVTDTKLLGAGTHTVNVKYTGTLDKNVDYEAGEGVTYNGESKEYTSTVSLVVNPLEGSVPSIEAEYSATYDKSKTQTLAGYGIELPEGWAWEDGSTELGMTAITAAAVYTPDDVANYDYSAVEGWDAATKTVKRTASVVLTKAKGTAPEAPYVIKTSARLENVGDFIDFSEFVTLGDWKTPSEELYYGVHTISLTYDKDIDTTHYTYETSGDVIWNSANSCFNFEVVITVDKPYLNLVTPPVSPEAKDYVKDTSYKYSDFALPTGWSYAAPDTAIANAGTVSDVKVLYKVDDDYDINPEDGFTVEEIDGTRYVVSTVSLTVNKIAGTVTAPTASRTVTFKADAADKKVSTYVSSFGEGWTLDNADAVLEYGENTITVKHEADTTNYTWEGYTVGDGVITTTVKVIFEKAVISTTVPPVLAEGTNNKTFAETGFKYSDFAIATEGWVYDAPDTEILKAGTVNAKVKYEIGADYKVPDDSNWTVEGNFIVSEIALTVERAVLPADAASAVAKNTPYTGSAITVEVNKNSTYTGLGEMSVAYPEGNINAGTYDVVANFAQGDNYLAGSVTFADALVISKKEVEAIEVPEISDTMNVGTSLSGAADGNGWSYSETYTIVEGENKIVVTKIIDAETAKNHDYTKAAEAKGANASENADKSITLTKEYTVTGKIPVGHISFEALAIEGVTVDDTDVSVTIIPEQGEEFELEHDSEGHIIFAEDYKLNTGKYTISIKKAKYLETVITFELSENQKLDLGQIVLVPGDIIGGPEGSETDGDGIIDIDDFVIGVRAFDHEVLDIVKSAADIDKNGANNVTDLGYIKANFGKSTAKDCTITVE